MILCIDIDAFFVSVEQALNPLLKGKAVIVGGVPSQRGVVASASYEARRFGIKAGMPLSHAYRLYPHAVFLGGNFRNYQHFSAQFHEILNHYSPAVEMTSLDEAFLDIRGTKRLFGEPVELGCRIKSKIKEQLDLPTTVGIARTRTIAKIAADQAKPDGLACILKENELTFLKPLPVNVLPGIGPKNFEVLKNLNIKTVEDFLKTPSWVLSLALGIQSRWIRLIISTPMEESIICSDSSPGPTTGGFTPDTNPGKSDKLSDQPHFLTGRVKSVSRETTFEEDTLDLDFIKATIYYLLERACFSLRQIHRQAQRVEIKVRFSDFKTVSTQTKIPATHIQQTIYPVALKLFRSLLTDRKRIRLVGVSLSNLTGGTAQSSLFDRRAEKLIELNCALDQARGRFGYGSLFTARTFCLRDHYHEDHDGYVLHTPSLSQ